MPRTIKDINEPLHSKEVHAIYKEMKKRGVRNYIYFGEDGKPYITLKQFEAEMAKASKPLEKVLMNLGTAKELYLQLLKITM